MMSGSIRTSLTLLLGIGLLAGCESEPEPAPPPPPPRVEVPPPPPPPAPIGDQAIQELIDRSIQAIATNLPKVPTVRDTKHRLVLRAMEPDADSRAAKGHGQSARVLQQTLTGLTQDKNITRLFRIVNAPQADPEKLKKIIGDTNPDDLLAPDSDEDIAPVDDDPRDVYLLSAQVTEVSRYAENQYAVSLRVEHPHTRQTVLTKEVQLNLYWDTDALQWREAK